MTDCISLCTGDADCVQMCMLEYDVSVDNCPCHKNCPDGCPCDVFDCTLLPPPIDASCENYGTNKNSKKCAEIANKHYD